MHDPRDLLVLLRSGAPAACLRRLLDAHGGAADVLRAGPAAWMAAGCPEASARALRRPDPARLGLDLAWLRADGRHLLAWNDDDYPALLRTTASPPAALFVAGNPDLLWHPQVALVGSRHPSATGQELAGEFAEALARAGWVVTSGLAEGVDTAAHAAALRHGRTIAVVARGLDRAYPAGNAALMDAIAGSGAVASEHPPGTAPLRQHFPSRNRLIAGLALGTVVIEAAERSGALITARQASEAGREVFALPGSVRNTMARGCHRLIRQGANLVESPAEVVSALRPVALALAGMLRGRLEEDAAAKAGNDAEADGDPSRAKLWQALGHEPVDLDQLQARTGLTVPTLSAMLLAMELDGHVSQRQGRYQRLGS